MQGCVFYLLLESTDETGNCNMFIYIVCHGEQQIVHHESLQYMSVNSFANSV